jgi:hypothetical protein
MVAGYDTFVFCACCKYNRGVEYVLNANTLFGAAFHVDGSHLSSHSTALIGCYGCESLSFEEVDAGRIRAEVRF